MHVFGAFELDIEPGTPDNPASLRVRSPAQPRPERGRAPIHHTGVHILRWLEGQLNSLQDELDQIRERARRAFQVA